MFSVFCLIYNRELWSRVVLHCLPYAENLVPWWKSTLNAGNLNLDEIQTQVSFLSHGGYSAPHLYVITQEMLQDSHFPNASRHTILRASPRGDLEEPCTGLQFGAPRFSWEFLSLLSCAGSEKPQNNLGLVSVSFKARMKVN